MNQILEASAEELYTNVPCGYLSTRPDGTICQVNEVFLKWTGYTSTTLLLGKHFRELLTVASRSFYETYYAPLLQQQGFVHESAFDLCCANRSEPLAVLINSTLIKDANGHLLLIRSTIFNVAAGSKAVWNNYLTFSRTLNSVIK